MTDSTPQRRHFSRIPFDTEYQLTNLDGNKHWSGNVIDLSLKGALIKRPEDIQLERGDKFRLQLMLNASTITIGMEASVAHIHDDYIGFECKYIDLNSMSHLRRTLELNLGDPRLLEREIIEMIKANYN